MTVRSMFVCVVLAAAIGCSRGGGSSGSGSAAASGSSETVNKQSPEAATSGSASTETATKAATSGSANAQAANSGSAPASTPPVTAGNTSHYPGTEDGAKQLLNELLTAADPRALTRTLRPGTADYKAVFIDSVAERAETGYSNMWNGGKAAITAKDGQTELLLIKATTDQLIAWPPEVDAEFPGGYKRVAHRFKPGLTVYRWKFVKPGETSGMAYDGLIYLGDHWAWFPKPWRVVGEGGTTNIPD